MAQLTIYLDDETLKKISSAAKREHEPISRWVKKRLVTSLQHTWPAHYFELFGSLANDETFKRPSQPSWSHDAKRQRL